MIFVIVTHTLKPAAIALFWITVGANLLSTTPGADSMYKIEVGQLDSSYEIRGFAWDSHTYEVYDADELVKEYDNALFIITNMQVTPQAKTTCSDPSAKCITSADCSHLQHKPSTTIPGLYTGTCNTTTGLCLAHGWCTVGDKTNTTQVLQGIGNLTVIAEYAVNFRGFKANKTAAITKTIQEIWDAVPSHGEGGETLDHALSNKGDASLSLSIQLDISCSRNYYSGLDTCDTKKSFAQLESITAKQQGNTRHLERFTKKWYYTAADGTLMRNVTTATGILVSLDPSSKIFEFSILNFLSGFGSFMPYWDKANIIGFLILVKIFKLDIVTKDRNRQPEELTPITS